MNAHMHQNFSVGSRWAHTFLTPPRNKQHLPSSTHFSFLLLVVGRRNLPPLRSNWTEARRRRRNCSHLTHSRPNTQHVEEEALQWAINSLWKSSCHCSTFPNTLFVVLGRLDIGTISICTSAHMQLSKAHFYSMILLTY